MLRKQVCLYLQDMPHFDGFLSFDSSWLAMMVVFIVMLQQDFSPIQHATVDAFGDVAGKCSKSLSWKICRQFAAFLGHFVCALSRTDIPESEIGFACCGPACSCILHMHSVSSYVYLLRRILTSTLHVVREQLLGSFSLLWSALTSCSTTSRPWFATRTIPRMR